MHIDDHSLCNDFPQQRELILRLINGNEEFARIAEAYTRIDTEIHALELDESPIGDDAMHELKHQRTLLKDGLYERMMAAE